MKFLGTANRLEKNCRPRKGAWIEMISLFRV